MRELTAFLEQIGLSLDVLNLGELQRHNIWEMIELGISEVFEDIPLKDVEEMTSPDGIISKLSMLLYARQFLMGAQGVDGEVVLGKIIVDELRKIGYPDWEVKNASLLDNVRAGINITVSELCQTLHNAYAAISHRGEESMDYVVNELIPKILEYVTIYTNLEFYKPMMVNYKNMLEVEVEPEPASEISLEDYGRWVGMIHIMDKEADTSPMSYVRESLDFTDATIESAKTFLRNFYSATEVEALTQSF